MTTSTTGGGFAAAVVAQINAELAAKGMSKTELASRAGVSMRAQARYLKGGREISIGLLERYSEALGLDLLTLLERARERCE